MIFIPKQVIFLSPVLTICTSINHKIAYKRCLSFLKFLIAIVSIIFPNNKVISLFLKNYFEFELFIK